MAENLEAGGKPERFSPLEICLHLKGRGGTGRASAVMRTERPQHAPVTCLYSLSAPVELCVDSCHQGTLNSRQMSVSQLTFRRDSYCKEVENVMIAGSHFHSCSKRLFF